MTDRYVIVYRDGAVGTDWDKEASDVILNSGPLGGPRDPAYRIRIREKARLDVQRVADTTNRLMNRCGKVFHPDPDKIARLIREKAYTYRAVAALEEVVKPRLKTLRAVARDKSRLDPAKAYADAGIKR